MAALKILGRALLEFAFGIALMIMTWEILSPILRFVILWIGKKFEVQDLPREVATFALLGLLFIVLIQVALWFVGLSEKIFQHFWPKPEEEIPDDEAVFEIPVLEYEQDMTQSFVRGEIAGFEWCYKNHNLSPSEKQELASRIQYLRDALEGRTGE